MKDLDFIEKKLKKIKKDVRKNIKLKYWVFLVHM